MREILLIDKPSGWTSFDVVAKIRSHYSALEGAKVKVGHAGTLDPFATGLLIVLVGEATKEQDKFMKLDKIYEATLRLGTTSTTGDPEGEILETPHDSFAIPTIEEVRRTLKKFTGKIDQIPPQYSAIKVNGRPAYKYARSGETVSLKSRPIYIHKIEATNYQYPELSLIVSCSSGTYIRTLASDIGKELQTGAYLTTLRRLSIGRYKVADAQNIPGMTAY